MPLLGGGLVRLPVYQYDSISTGGPRRRRSSLALRMIQCKWRSVLSQRSESVRCRPSLQLMLYMAGLGLEMPLLETMPTVTPYCFGPAPAGYYTD